MIYDLLDTAFLIQEASNKYKITVSGDQILTFNFQNEHKLENFAKKQIKDSKRNTYHNIKIIDNKGNQKFNAINRANFFKFWRICLLFYWWSRWGTIPQPSG